MAKAKTKAKGISKLQFIYDGMVVCQVQLPNNKFYVAIVSDGTGSKYYSETRDTQLAEDELKSIVDMLNFKIP